MVDVVQVNGQPVIDYMARDYESLLQAMRAQIPSRLGQWTDFENEADFGNVLLELFAHLGDILSYYQDRVANESFLGTARTRRSVIEHLRLIGYELGTAAPAAASLNVTVPASTGTVTITKGDAFATKSAKDRPAVRFEYTRDSPLVIDFGAIPAVGGRKTFTGLPVEEGRLIDSEVLGVSDGTPNQRFALTRAGVILTRLDSTQPAADVIVRAGLPGALIPWTRKESLAFSQATADFVVDVDESNRATVIFGDGVFGTIPPQGAQIVATYRTGGGLAGNVPAGSITTIVDAPALTLLGTVSVTNPGPATGGGEREDLAHAVQQAPAVFRSLRRAVTAADYEALARSYKGVGKVRAVGTAWNTVTLYVAPVGGGKVSDVLEAGLIGYFEDKRMLGQIVEVSDVDYVPIFVTAEIAVQSFAVPGDVVALVQRAAADLLAFDKVDFNQTVYLSKFYEESQSVPGVQFVNITEFRRGDQPTPVVEPHGRIVLGPNEVPIVPTDQNYVLGLKVVLVSQGGR
ncbi:baseplate J/gp47 family protein [Kutzneria chonburiensis]|uniref:Baseplate J/gp47 family protein n=1 Tax=Kutzneria chonburiensis TaxID=1483604 RepID=A0ABV6MNL8_9PSEU